jgi:oligopeptide/dipeptide ABC transporter ATP-binding protein
MTSPVLSIENLCLQLTADRGGAPLLSGVSFEIQSGEIFGLVGESGSGKTLTALAAMRLLPPAIKASGRVMFDGVDLLALSEQEMRKLRGSRIGMVFQEPVAALNPTFTIGAQLISAIRAHNELSRSKARERAVELLEMVGIPEPRSRLGFYPHQFSGGMCQRVMIAMALAGGAKLLLADEPTTSLDVTTQDEIVRLLEKLSHERGIAVLFISHDLGLVARLCHRIAVAYAGELVEVGTADALLQSPLHPYTQGLVRCVPDLTQIGVLRGGIPGTPPMPGNWPVGCRFQPRCPAATEGCEQPQTASAMGDERSVRCWRAASGNGVAIFGESATQRTAEKVVS